MNLKTFLIVLFASFLVFNLNFTNIGETDTIPAALLPFNILSGHGIYFDDYSKLLWSYYRDINFFEKSHDHIVSSFPIMSGLISVPIYTLFYYALKAQLSDSVSSFINASFVLEKLSASIIAALSVGFFYILIYLLSKDKKYSLIFSLIFAFATQTFSISSQALWQHGTANLFLILSEVFLIRGLRQDHQRRYLPAIFFAILAFMARNALFPYLLFINFILYANDRKNGRRILILSIIGVAFVLYYNFYFYHYPFGDVLNRINTFSLKNFPGSLAGLLWSPSRGMIFYTPFYLFALFSLIYWKRIKDQPLRIAYILNFFYFISVILLNSFWGLWWGGDSWGNRFFADLAVPAVVLSFIGWQFLKPKLLKVTFYTLVIYSVSIQLIGVFAYPNSYWNVYPEHVDTNQDRLWDFKDNPVLRSVAIGADWSNGPRLLTFLSHKQDKTYYGSERDCSLNLIRNETYLGYRVLTVAFKNNSQTNWVTTGSIPPFKSLNLRQVFMLGEKPSVISPITPVNFPLDIKAGQEIRVKMVVITPRSSYDSVVITPEQNQNLWFSSCHLFIAGQKIK